MATRIRSKAAQNTLTSHLGDVRPGSKPGVICLTITA